MQHLALLIAALICSSLSAQNNTIDSEAFKTQDIIVNITNFDNNEGKVLVGLYNSEGNFLNETVKGTYSKISNESCTVIFKNVVPGTYAISVFHDENDNNKLDTNFFGIPKEDTGTSNNAPARFGPPKWRDAKFEVRNNTITQNIKL